MKKFLALLFLSFFAPTVDAFAGETFVAQEFTVQKEKGASMSGGMKGAESIGTSPEESNIPARKERGLDFEPHKLNYIIINEPFSANSQVKFQISAKFRVFEGNFNYFRRNYFPLYVAYTQKSFWNVGKPSMPFEENNYNPEVFLDFRLDVKLTERFRLKNFVISPYEHESNGVDGPDSRSWNRSYILASF